MSKRLMESQSTPPSAPQRKRRITTANSSSSSALNRSSDDHRASQYSSSMDFESLLDDEQFPPLPSGYTPSAPQESSPMEEEDEFGPIRPLVLPIRESNPALNVTLNSEAIDTFLKDSAGTSYALTTTTPDADPALTAAASTPPNSTPALTQEQSPPRLTIADLEKPANSEPTPEGPQPKETAPQLLPPLGKKPQNQTPKHTPPQQTKEAIVETTIPPAQMDTSMDEDDENSLREALKAAALAAEEDEETALLAFPTYHDFANIVINPEPSTDKDENEDKGDKAPHKTHYLTIQYQNTPKELQHRSDNPGDFINRETLTHVGLAKSKKAHKLGLLSLVLLRGYRVVAKVANKDASKEKIHAWLKHSIRDVVIQNGGKASDLIAILDMKKNSFDWKVVSLTKAGYNAFCNTRAAFDPRSHVLSLFRPFDLRPPLTQKIIFTGVIHHNETTETEQKQIVSTLVNQLNTAILAHHVQISQFACLPPTQNGTITEIEFTFSDAEHARIIKPENMPKAFILNGELRKITAKWPRRCAICASESHTSSKDNHCPWMEHDFNGVKANMFSPSNLAPGASMRTKRPREEDDDNDTLDSLISDARPNAPKKRKTKGTPTTETTQAPVTMQAETTEPPIIPTTNITAHHTHTTHPTHVGHVTPTATTLTTPLSPPQGETSKSGGVNAEGVTPTTA